MAEQENEEEVERILEEFGVRPVQPMDGARDHRAVFETAVQIDQDRQRHLDSKPELAELGLPRRQAQCPGPITLPDEDILHADMKARRPRSGTTPRRKVDGDLAVSLTLNFHTLEEQQLLATLLATAQAKGKTLHTHILDSLADHHSG